MKTASPLIKPFTGIPAFQSTAKPPHRAVMINGRLKIPSNAFEVICFGVYK